MVNKSPGSAGGVGVDMPGSRASPGRFEDSRAFGRSSRGRWSKKVVPGGVQLGDGIGTGWLRFPGTNTQLQLGIRDWKSNVKDERRSLFQEQRVWRFPVLSPTPYQMSMNMEMGLLCSWQSFLRSGWDVQGGKGPGVLSSVLLVCVSTWSC